MGNFFEEAQSSLRREEENREVDPSFSSDEEVGPSLGWDRLVGKKDAGGWQSLAPEGELGAPYRGVAH